jgi:uncharacterized protein (DUF1810 family)
MNSHLNLQRFVQAQAAVYSQVLRELGAGRKTTHWMWFIFPQISGLGQSQMARAYAIQSLDEARAYLDDAVLGPRLRACTALVNDVQDKSAHAIFSSPDDMKFRSCMTLFALAAPQEVLFRAALEKYFAGAPDRSTLDLVK